MRVGIYDEAQTLYGPVDKTFATLKQLHVQEVRAQPLLGRPVRRRADAPGARRRTRPTRPTTGRSTTARCSYAAQYGIHVLFSIYGTPAWANGGTAPNVAPTHGDRPAQLRARRRDALQRPVPWRPTAASLPAGQRVARLERAEQPALPRRRSTSGPRRAGRSRARSTTRRSATPSTAASTRTLARATSASAAASPAPRGNNNPNSTPPVGLAARVPPRRQEGGAEDVRRLGAPPVLRRAERPADDEAGRRAKGAPATAVTLGNISDLIKAADAALRQQADLDHRVRLPDEPARPALRRLATRSRRRT